MVRARLSTASLCALLMGLLAIPQLASSTESGRPGCTFDEAVLTVKVPTKYPFANISRDGDEIRVTTGLSGRTRCAGGTPTVFDTDRVIVRGGAGDFGILALDTTGGPFAPGRTDEGDGASEIEFRIRQRGSVEFFIHGGDGGDAFAFGFRRDRLAVNFNAGEPIGDVDLVARKGILPLVGAGPGDDVITAEGQRGIMRPWRGGISISGHDGDNELTGGPGRNSLRGGAGEDRMRAGAGDDFIEAGRKGSDYVKCGKGFDRANVDRTDRVRGCERVRVRKLRQQAAELQGT